MDELAERREARRDAAEAAFAAEYACLGWAERQAVREYLLELHAAAVRREQSAAPAPVVALRGRGA